MKKITFLSLVMILAFASCKTKGCTDLQAVNYSAEAEKDDGTCKFEGDILVWMHETTANLYESEDDDLEFIEIFIDNASVGNLPLYKYKNLFPDCGDTNCFNYNIPLTDKNKTGMSIKFIDNLEQERGGFSFSLEGGECKAFQINYE